MLGAHATKDDHLAAGNPVTITLHYVKVVVVVVVVLVVGGISTSSRSRRFSSRTTHLLNLCLFS